MENKPNFEQLHSDLEKSIFTNEPVFTYDKIPAKFIELANVIANYPHDNEDWIYVGEYSNCDLASMIIGAFWHFTEWHAGQDSESYAAYSALSQVFHPGMTDGPDEDSTEEDCYQMLGELAEAYNKK